MSKLTVWLTPLWILALGVTIGAVVLVLAWCLCWLVNRRAARVVFDAVREGMLRQISYVLAALAALVALASPTMPVRETIESIRRLPYAQSPTLEIDVPAEGVDVPVDVAFRADELQRYTIESDQDVAVNVETGQGFVSPTLVVHAGEPYHWTPGGTAARGFSGDVGKLYLTSQSDAPAKVTLHLETDVAMPQVRALGIAAIGVVALYLAYLLMYFLAPRVAVIAAATSKETVSQPIFTLLILIGVAALVSFVFTPYNTFGEDVKMLKTSGMTTIKILAIIMALWTASTSVADEIEGRTALTVLSKPVGRRQFILGKFLGIVWPIVLMFLILGFVFLLTVSFKVVYDARESAKTTPQWQECYVEVVRIVPGLLLAFFEAVIMAAISVAVSTRLPMLPNLVICGSIYVLGHLAALIVKTSAGNIVFVRFIGRLLSVVLPVLDHFEIEGAIAGASAVPASYLWWALGYTVLYSTAAMLLALIFFEDRDLA